MWPCLFRSFRTAHVAAGPGGSGVRRSSTTRLGWNAGGDRDRFRGRPGLPEFEHGKGLRQQGGDASPGQRMVVHHQHPHRDAHAVVPRSRQVSRCTTRPSRSGLIVSSSRPPSPAARSATIPRPDPGDHGTVAVVVEAAPRPAGPHARPTASAAPAPPRCAPQRTVAITCSASACLTAFRRPSRSASMTSSVTSGASPRGVPRWLHHTGTPLAAVNARASATSARSRPAPVRHPAQIGERRPQFGAGNDRRPLSISARLSASAAGSVSPRDRCASTPTENSVCAIESCSRPAIACRCRSAASSAWLAFCGEVMQRGAGLRGQPLQLDHRDVARGSGGPRTAAYSSAEIPSGPSTGTQTMPCRPSTSTAPR